MYFFEKLSTALCVKEVKQRTVTMGWPVLWTVWLGSNSKPETKTQVRMIFKQLRLEKYMWLDITLLDSGLVDKVRAA